MTLSTKCRYVFKIFQYIYLTLYQKYLKWKSRQRDKEFLKLSRREKELQDEIERLKNYNE